MKRWSLVDRACEAANKHRWTGRRQSGDGGAGLSSAVLGLLVGGPLLVLAVWFGTGVLLRPGPPELGDPVQVSVAPTVSSPTLSPPTTSPGPDGTSARTTPSTASSPSDADSPGAAAVIGAAVCPAGVDDDDDDPDEGDPDDDWCED